MENRYLIRKEERAGAQWYELTHDRLIGPIKDSNSQRRNELEKEESRFTLRKFLHKRFYSPLKKNKKSIIVGGAILFIIFYIGYFYFTPAVTECVSPSGLVTALPQGEFTKDLRDVEIDSKHLAYVLSADSDYTSVIDTCTNAVQTPIKTGKGVALAVNNATNKMYVANQDSNTVSVVDLNNPENIKSITGVVRPADIVIDKEKNKIYVADSDSNSVSVIDGSTDQPLVNQTVGSRPIDLDIDPKNHIVYARFSAEPFISAIRESGSGYESSNIALNYVPNGMAVDSKSVLYLGKPPGSPEGTSPKKLLNLLPGNQSENISQGNQLRGKIHIIDMPAYGFKNINGTALVPPKKIQNEIPMGDFGQGINILADPNKDLIYLVSKDSNTVSIMNSTAKRLIQTVHVGNNPNSISMDSEEGKLYVTSEDDETPLVVIDTNQILNQVDGLKVASSPTGVAIDPETRMIFVANFDSDNVTVINGDSQEVVKTIDLTPNSTLQAKFPYYPISIAVNPNTHMVYVANFLNNSVSVIDGTKNNTVVQTVPVGNHPSGLDIDPEKNMLYVANTNSSTVSVIDTTNNEPIQEVLVGSKPVDISVDPENHMIYVANFGSNNTSIINGTKNNTVVQTLPVGNHPSGLDIDPEKNMLYVANQDSDTVSVLNISKNWVNVKEINVFGNDGSGQTCTELRVKDNITAIGHNGADEPRNVLDDNPDTGWSNFGSGS